MFDIGWTEMMVIAMLALIIIGPKDLPGALRTVGQWVRKARSLAREFQSGVDEMVREAELDDARKALEATNRGNIAKSIANAVDPSGELSAEAKAFETSAREATQVEKIGGPTKSAETESSDKTTSDAKAKDEPETQADTPRAKVVKHPAKIAPGNSVRPPQDASPAEETAPGSKTTGSKTTVREAASDKTAEGAAATTEESASKAG